MILLNNQQDTTRLQQAAAKHISVPHKRQHSNIHNLHEDQKHKEFPRHYLFVVDFYQKSLTSNYITVILS